MEEEHRNWPFKKNGWAELIFSISALRFVLDRPKGRPYDLLELWCFVCGILGLLYGLYKGGVLVFIGLFFVFSLAIILGTFVFAGVLIFVVFTLIGVNQ